jgi:outer membrane protein
MPADTLVPTETLGMAIADAYANNPQLQAQRARLRQLDEGVIEAGSAYRLNLGLVGSLSYSQGPTQGFFIGEFQTGRTRNFGAALTASQILLNGGRTAAQVSAAEADVLAGREQLRATENFLLLEVIDSYISVRRDQQVVAIQQRSVDSYGRQVDQARARERAGDLTRTDIAQADAQLQIVRASLSQAQASLQANRARFAVAVGRNPGILAPEPALPGLPASLDMAYMIAERESPSLWSAVLSRRAGKERIASERANRSPQLTAEGSYGYTTLNTIRNADLRQTITGGVTLTIPILAQGILGSRIRTAIAEEQRLGFVVENVRRQVDQAVLSSWNNAIAARDQLSAGEAAVRAGEDALTGVRRGFSEGFRSNFEVLDSEQRLLTAQLIVANARYTRYAGQANLLAYLGRLEAASLEQSTQRYDETAYLKTQRSHQIGPFQLLLKPIDQLQKPSTRGLPAPVVVVATDPTIGRATTPPPEGTLGTELPVDPAVPVRDYQGSPAR